MYEDEHPRVTEKLCHIIMYSHATPSHTLAEPFHGDIVSLSSAYRQPAVRVNHVGTNEAENANMIPGRKMRPEFLSETLPCTLL